MLDRARGVLLRDGVRVAATPRALDLLGALADRAGHTIEKDDLVQRVWGRTAVDENNLARQISSLRKALGETAGQREYIATVPGVGYRFVAPVVALPPDESESVAAELELADTPPAPANPPDVRPSVTPLRSRRSPAVLLAGLAAAAVVLIAIAGIATRGAGPSPLAAQRSVRQITFGGGLQIDSAWSPDGQRIAFASDQLGTLDIWVQGLTDVQPTRLTSLPDREWQPAWSPDGQWLVFRSDRDGGGLFVMPSSGGTPRRITRFGDHPQWSPAGDLILFSNATVRTGARKLYVVEANGGEPREVGADVLKPFLAATWTTSVEAAWHPDGTAISIWGRVGNRWTFVTMPVAGGPSRVSPIPEDIERQVQAGQPTLGRFVWARSGRFLYFEGQTGDTGNVWRVKVDPTTMAWNGVLEPLTLGVGDETNIALSGDGTRLAFTARSRRTRVWAFDFDPHEGKLTGAAQPLTEGQAGRIEVDTLPDGSRLALRSILAGRNEVREYTTGSRQDRVLLVSNQRNSSSPRWSADGRSLAYARYGATGAGLAQSVVAVFSPEQGREQLLRLPGGESLRPSDWSNDGRVILGDCRSATGDETVICSMPAAERQDTRAAGVRVLFSQPHKNLYVPRFSPDQRWVSFVAVDANGATTSQVYVAPVSGGAWIPITDGRAFDDKPRWSPDGRTLYFVSDRGGYLNLSGRRVDPADGTPIGDVFPVTAFDSPRRALPSNISEIEFAISRNRLFLPLAETEANIWVLDPVDR